MDRLPDRCVGSLPSADCPGDTFLIAEKRGKNKEKTQFGKEGEILAMHHACVMPFSTLFLRDRLTVRKMAAIILALGGVLLIGSDPSVFYHLDAALWGAGAAFAMATATATILMRHCPSLGVFRLQAWIALVALPSLLLLSLIFESDHWQLVSGSDISAFWAPLYSAVGASIVGHGIVCFLLGRYPASTVTPLLLLAPILASLFGVLLSGDTLGLGVDRGRRHDACGHPDCFPAAV